MERDSVCGLLNAVDFVRGATVAVRTDADEGTVLNCCDAPPLQGAMTTRIDDSDGVAAADADGSGDNDDDIGSVSTQCPSITDVIVPLALNDHAPFKAHLSGCEPGVGSGLQPKPHPIEAPVADEQPVTSQHPPLAPAAERTTVGVESPGVTPGDNVHS
jgi:hypothetical protein